MSIRLVMLVIALATAAVWAAVLASALSFYSWASEYFADGGSINAANDLAYANGHLLVAGAGFSAACACIIWIARRRSTKACTVLIWLAAFGVAFYFGDHARPIHLFPTGIGLMLAFLVSGGFMVAALVGTWLLDRYAAPEPVQAAAPKT